MSEQIATPAASVPRDAHSTANNIVKGITDRTNGKSLAAAQPPITGQQPLATPPPADPNAGKEKYVVEGREVWLTPQERTSWIQKGMAFEPRMDQLARLAQEQQQLTRALIANPLAVLKNIAKRENVPIESLYEKVLDGDWPDSVKEIIGKRYYHNAVEPLNMTPEQLKAREDAKWRQEREQQDKSSQEMAIRRENQMKFQKAMGDIKANIVEAMKESGLPNNDTELGAEMARMVADTMRVAYFKRQNITPKQAIEFVKARIKSVQSAFYDHLDAESLVKELGEANTEKVKKYLLKLVQSNGNNLPAVPNGKKPSARSGARETMNLDQFHDYLSEIKKKG